MYEKLVQELCRLADEQFFDFEKSPYIKAADVVEVVRCGECMFWDAPPSCEGLARCRTGESGVRFRKAYDFCSRAQKDGRRC